MKKYNVKFFVWSDIEIDVEAENKDQAKERGLKKAIEEQPLVAWELDEQNEIIVKEE